MTNTTKKIQIVARNLFVEERGRLLAEQAGITRSQWSGDMDGRKVFMIVVQSGLHPWGVTVVNTLMLCAALDAAGIWHKTEDRVEYEVERQEEWPDCQWVHNAFLASQPDFQA